MRVEVLSDHGRHQLQKTQHALQDADANVTEWRSKYQESWHQVQTTRREKALWRRMLGVSSAAEREALVRAQGTWQQVLGAGYSRNQIHERAQRQSAGVRGEDALAWALACLPDEWVMFRGYRNGRGETDHVLVGPLGVWAVEVKHQRILLHVSGDEWWYEKLSSRGNVVKRGPAVDGGGRSWSRQVNDIAGDLRKWLDRRGYGVPIRTAVMLMHEGALLGDCQNPTVNLIGTRPEDLLNALVEFQSPLTVEACEEIVRLVRRDHQFHQERRRRR